MPHRSLLSSKVQGGDKHLESESTRLGEDRMGKPASGILVFRSSQLLKWGFCPALRHVSDQVAMQCAVALNIHGSGKFVPGSSGAAQSCRCSFPYMK